MSPDSALSAWLDGENDAETLAELRSWLRADPRHVQQARDELALHLALRARLRPSDATAAARLLAAVQTGRQRGRTSQRQRAARECMVEVDWRRRRRHVRASLALAAGILITCTAAVVGWAGSIARRQPVADDGASLAQITAVHGRGDVERDGVRHSLSEGEHLRAGDEVIAGPDSRIAWRVGHDDLELRGGRCRLLPRPDTLVRVTDGLLRLTRTSQSSRMPLVRLMSATSEIETSDAALQIVVGGTGTRLVVEQGSAVFSHGGIRQTVRPSQSAFGDATGAYRVLSHFSQVGPAPNACVEYGEPVADPGCGQGWALRGVVLDGAREVYFAYDRREPLALEAGTELRFSYCVRGSGPLRVFAHNLDLQADITADLGVVRGSGWQTATVHLADFHRQGVQSEMAGAVAGDRLENCVIASDRPETLTELRVDDVIWLAPAMR